MQFEDLAYQFVSELQSFAKDMESTLEKWEKEVKRSRSCYYELNYFTTLQLLKLRKELGLMRQIPHRAADPEVLTLLECISPQITSEVVQDVVGNLSITRAHRETCLASDISHDTKAFPGYNITATSDTGPKLSSSSMNNQDHHSSMISLHSESVSIASEVSETFLQSAKPLLTKNDLNDKQMQYFDDLFKNYNYGESLILKAIEECPDTANLYDLQDWCDENEGMFSSDEEIATIESCDESSSDEEGIIHPFSSRPEHPRSSSTGIF